MNAIIKTIDMKILLTLAVVLPLTFCPASLQAQVWQTPVIKGYGKVVDYPDAAIQPHPEKDYKILFHITSCNEKEGVNRKLWKIARLLNLMGLRKVPPENIHIVAVISGKATPVVLSKISYSKRYGRPNPNLDLLQKLTRHGVKVEVCGQAMAEHGFDAEKELNRFTTLTLSAMIDVPIYQKKGYVVMF